MPSLRFTSIPATASIAANVFLLITAMSGRGGTLYICPCTTVCCRRGATKSRTPYCRPNYHPGVAGTNQTPLQRGHSPSNSHRANLNSTPTHFRAYRRAPTHWAFSVRRDAMFHWNCLNTSLLQRDPIQSSPCCIPSLSLHGTHTPIAPLSADPILKAQSSNGASR